MDSFVKGFRVKETPTGEKVLIPFFTPARSTRERERQISRVGQREQFDAERPGDFHLESSSFGSQPGFSAAKIDPESQSELWDYLTGNSRDTKRYPVRIHKVLGKRTDDEGLAGDWHVYLNEMEPQEESIDPFEGQDRLKQKISDRSKRTYRGNVPKEKLDMMRKLHSLSNSSNENYWKAIAAVYDWAENNNVNVTKKEVEDSIMRRAHIPESQREEMKAHVKDRDPSSVSLYDAPVELLDEATKQQRKRSQIRELLRRGPQYSVYNEIREKLLVEDALRSIEPERLEAYLEAFLDEYSPTKVIQRDVRDRTLEAMPALLKENKKKFMSNAKIGGVSDEDMKVINQTLTPHSKGVSQVVRNG